MIFFIFSGCPQISDAESSGSKEEQKDEDEDEDKKEDPPPVVTEPELKEITVNSISPPTIGTQITATAVYQSKTGAVTWQWTVDNVPIEGATSAAYIPVVTDFNKTLEVRAAPTGTTKGESKIHTFTAKVTVPTDIFPIPAHRYSVKDLFKTDAGKFYVNTGSNICHIPEETYNTMKLIFDANRDTGAIQFFKFPITLAGALDIDKEPNSAKKITLTVNDSLTGTKAAPLIIRVPRIPSNYTEIDQLLYFKTPVYLTDSDSGDDPNAKYVHIVVEDGGYLYIPDDQQDFKGVIRAESGAIVVDAGGTGEGYSAGDDALYWFEYGSYGWVQTPIASRAPFISADEPYLYNKTDKPGVVWVPEKPDSFVWVGNETFLLQGTIKQVRTFSLSAHLTLTPGSEFIIDIQPSESHKLLLLEGKNIAKWLPNPMEDYYDDLTLGGKISPEPRIHIAGGSAIIDYAADPDPGTESAVEYICTPLDKLPIAPPFSEKIWEWDPGADKTITVENKPIKGGWKSAGP